MKLLVSDTGNKLLLGANNTLADKNCCCSHDIKLRIQFRELDAIKCGWARLPDIFCDVEHDFSTCYDSIRAPCDWDDPDDPDDTFCDHFSYGTLIPSDNNGILRRWQTLVYSNCGDPQGYTLTYADRLNYDVFSPDGNSDYHIGDGCTLPPFDDDHGDGTPPTELKEILSSEITDSDLLTLDDILAGTSWIDRTDPTNYDFASFDVDIGVVRSQAAIDGLLLGANFFNRDLLQARWSIKSAASIKYLKAWIKITTWHFEYPDTSVTVKDDEQIVVYEKTGDTATLDGDPEDVTDYTDHIDADFQLSEEHELICDNGVLQFKSIRLLKVTTSHGPEPDDPEDDPIHPGM